uniref:hypothetical protein n=1 Tax=Trichocoleus desertorum TaxID=1481672 RepID=UPI0025B3CC8F|nr:hypothetical protein [Trichocoleus desertorum]
MPYTVKQRLQGMREAARKILLAKEENLSVFPLYDGEIIATGLTKREYFAAIALQGLMASTTFADGPHNAELAVNAADALIAELNKPVE